MTHEAAPSHRLIFGQILHFLGDPGENDAADAFEFIEDGALHIRDGRIADIGPRAAVLQRCVPTVLSQAERTDYGRQLIVPGFVDTHCHYPQSGIIASFGKQLLDWLKDYTFPTEARFSDPEVCARTAQFFLDRLVAHGTTTASVFATVHAASVDAIMAEADARHMRLLAGKVMMDRNAPASLCDTVEQGQRDCEALIQRWHNKGRLRYSVTPRFAPTSSAEQLKLAGQLFQSQPDLHLQSHLAENPDEIRWVQQLFPNTRDYLDVYEQFGLLGPKAIYGHCIHLSPREQARMTETGTAAAFCPTSNLFLGSGFFNHAEAVSVGVRVGLATDVGGGTSFSMLKTMGEAYKVAQVHQRPLSALRAWYLATLGGAQALQLDAFIGNFAVNKEADFIVINPFATAELAFRLERGATLQETLFALMILGDERCIIATHILGRPVAL